KGLAEQAKGLAEQAKALEWSEGRATELEKTIASRDEALTWREQQVAELEKAKSFWQQESASLNLNLQNTQRQLSVATDTLAGIYASRGWKFITRLRRMRDTLTRRGKSHE